MIDIVSFFKKYKRHIAVILLITVLIIIRRFVASVDFEEFKAYLRETPEMFVGVIIASLFAYISTAMAWSLCMGDEAIKIPFHKLFVYRLAGDMLAAFNPTSIVAGESLKAVILKKEGVESSYAVSSILLHRVLIFLASAFLIVISIIYLALRYLSNNGASLLFLLIIIAVTTLLGLVVLRFLVHPKLFIGKAVLKLKNKTGWKFLTEKLLHSVIDMNRVTSIYFRENKVKFLLAFLLSVLNKIFISAEFYVILNIMGMDSTLMEAVVAEMGVMLMRTLGTFIPAQIGVEEYGNKIMLDLIGISSNEVWLVVSLMRRGRQLFWLIIAGLFGIIITRKLKLKIEK